MQAEAYQGADGMTYRVTRLSAEDESRIFRHWESGLGIKNGDRYSADCPACYLNSSHSLDYHNAKTGKGV